MSEMKTQSITTCLWYDRQAEDAVHFYTSLFPNSSIGAILRYGKEGFEIHGMPEGTVQTIDFILDGRCFTALNGGPLFQFTEAISMMVHCDSADEVDHYWNGLGAGGDPEAQRCGWLKDRFGLTWQIIPREFMRMMNDPDKSRVGRVMQAMLQMTKLDLPELRRAYNGS